MNKSNNIGGRLNLIIVFVCLLVGWGLAQKENQPVIEAAGGQTQHIRPGEVPAGLTPADWQQIQTLIQTNYVKASNVETGDLFGYSVAISGDTIVIGASLEDSNATGVNGDQTNNSLPQSGAAYVYVRYQGGWVQEAYLKASNPDETDTFGDAVAISGDTIVIGAELEDSNATGVNGNQTNNIRIDSGAAYVFIRQGNQWSQQAYLKASNTGAGHQFGHSVAIWEDTIVVGALNENSNATGINGQGTHTAGWSGAAYIFIRTDGIWSQDAYVKASNTGAEDSFGKAVAIFEDTVVIGASKEDSNAVGVNGDQANNLSHNSGAAYVFVRHNQEWSQQAYLKAFNSQEYTHFGFSVAVYEDTVVIGTSSTIGGAYIFHRIDGEWQTISHLIASNIENNDGFGTSVAIGENTIAVGARVEDSNATGINGDQHNNLASGSGAVYLFTNNGGDWNQSHYIKASNTGAYDYFGDKVALSGELLVVGAWGEDSNATNQQDNSFPDAGAVYTFEPGFNLAVDVVGLGAGQVTSTPAGIDCPITCTAGFIENSIVTLTATAETGSTFTGWSGDVSSTANPITLTMDMDHTITATFTLNQYELNVAKNGAGLGVVSSQPAGINCGGDCAESVDYGTVITLTAAPEVGSTFAGWSGACVGLGACVLTIEQAETVTATFTLNQYELTVAKTGSGLGVVSSQPAGINCGGDCAESVDYGTVITLTAAPEVGSTFAGWSGACGGLGACVLTIEQAETVTATFTLNQYELTVAKNGSGLGVVSSQPAGINCGVDCAELLDYGTVITLTAAPEVGSTFAGWSGACGGLGACVLTIEQTEAITASFTLNLPTVYELFLPLVTRPFALQLGLPYPSQPVIEQGAVYYTNTIQLPAELPAGGQYYLSASGNGLSPVIIDDRLLIEVNGEIIFSQTFGQPPSGLIIALTPELVAQMTGQKVTIYYQDVYGNQQAATGVWLIWIP